MKLSIALLILLLAGCLAPESLIFEGFQLVDEETNRDATTMKFENGKDIIRLKILHDKTRSQADDLTSKSVLTITSLYGTTAASYPGQITREIICDEAFIPDTTTISESGTEITYLSAFLSERLTYGACTADLTSYRTITAWAYCPGTSDLRQLEYISPKGQYQEKNLKFVTKNICN